MHFNTRCSKVAFGLQVNLAEGGGTRYFCWQSILGEERPLKRMAAPCAYLYPPGHCFPSDRRAEGWTSRSSRQVGAGTLPNAILSPCLGGEGDFQISESPWGLLWRRASIWDKALGRLGVGLGDL